MKTNIIARRTVEGAYGINVDQMIVDHPTHGRLLLSQGYGGEGVRGETYRWRYGVVVQLHDNDTFAALDAPWNDCISVHEAATNGFDPSRPALDWDGSVIERLALSL